MAEVLENRIVNPEEIPEEVAPELPEIQSTALTMEYAEELRELLNQLMDAIHEENDTTIKEALLREYNNTLEKYDRLVNPPQTVSDNFTLDVKKRILQSCDKALKLIEEQLETGEIDLDTYFESLATIFTEMERYANQ